MKLQEKILIAFLKTMGYISMFGLSSYLMYQNFYDGSVSTKVELGFSFLIGMAVIFVILLKMVLRARKAKEIAYEVTKALGTPTKGINPIFIEGLNFVLIVLPMLMLAWLEFLLGFYTANLYMVIIYIVGSIGLGYVFRFFAVSYEQAVLTDAEQRKEDNFINRIKN